MSQFCLKWSNHVPNLLTVFENLKSMETLVDVTLTCEGRILKAHKLILSAGSKFFQNLFLANPCTHPVIIMHDMKYNILKAIIEFMYRGEISIAQDQLDMLLKAAKTLDIKGLAEISNEGTQSQDSELQNCSLQSTVPNSSHVQTAGSFQQVKRKRIRSRKRSCDSTYSNDEIPLKIKEPTSPEIQELNVTQEHANDESLPFSGAFPSGQSSSSVRVSDMSMETNPVISPSKDSSDGEVISVAESHAEPMSLQERSLNTEQVNLRSPKRLLQNRETLQSIDNSTPGSAAIPSDSLNSIHMLDPNDSEDGDMVDVKPHFLRFYEGAETVSRDRFAAEYLNDNDLCTVFQRCRNPSQFAVNIARRLFTPDELRESNCRGVKDKSALDRKRLHFIRTAVMKFYNILPLYEVDIWKQCMQSIDSRCRHERRPKFKNAVISFGFSDEN